MTKSHLRACSTCARHVRVTEAACPFCGAALSDEFRASPAPQPPRTRLSRAALFAFGTGTLALVPGCSSSSPTAPSDDAGPSIVDAAYGGPPFDGSIQPLYGAPSDAGPIEVVDAAYGGPPLGFDGSAPTDASDAGDSGPEDSGDQ